MTCPLCSGVGREIEVARHYMDDPLYTCNTCGLVHADRRAPEAWVEWPENYNPTWPAARARQVYVAEFLKQHNLLSDVFDISMGDGFFLDECERRGTKTSGTNETITEDFDADHHEVVCVNWTLENTADPVGMLKWARDHGDYVCIATGSRILVPFKKPLWAYLDKSPTHLHPNHFSVSTLSRALYEAELYPVEFNRYVDTDHLVVIAKVTGMKYPTWDRPDDVIDFFERWHEDTKCYARG